MLQNLAAVTFTSK